MSSYAKWSSNGPIGQALKEEIIKGDYIRRGITAAEVWKNNEKYNKYFKLDNFRTNYNKMKKKLLRNKVRKGLMQLSTSCTVVWMVSLFYFYKLK